MSDFNLLYPIEVTAEFFLHLSGGTIGYAVILFSIVAVILLLGLGVLIYQSARVNSFKYGLPLLLLTFFVLQFCLATNIVMAEKLKECKVFPAVVMIEDKQFEIDHMVCRKKENINDPFPEWNIK